MRLCFSRRAERAGFPPRPPWRARAPRAPAPRRAARRAGAAARSRARRTTPTSRSVGRRTGCAHATRKRTRRRRRHAARTGTTDGAAERHALSARRVRRVRRAAPRSPRALGGLVFAFQEHAEPRGDAQVVVQRRRVAHGERAPVRGDAAGRGAPGARAVRAVECLDERLIVAQVPSARSSAGPRRARVSGPSPNAKVLRSSSCASARVRSVPAQTHCSARAANPARPPGEGAPRRRPPSVPRRRRRAAAERGQPCGHELERGGDVFRVVPEWDHEGLAARGVAGAPGSAGHLPVRRRPDRVRALQDHRAARGQVHARRQRGRAAQDEQRAVPERLLDGLLLLRAHVRVVPRDARLGGARQAVRRRALRRREQLARQPRARVGDFLVAAKRARKRRRLKTPLFQTRATAPAPALRLVPRRAERQARVSLVRGLGDERQRDAVGGGRLREKRFGFRDAANALEPGGAPRTRAVRTTCSSSGTGL